MTAHVYVRPRRLTGSRLVLAICFALILPLLAAAPAHAVTQLDETPDDVWMTNGVGSVNAVTSFGDVVYVGGSFTGVRQTPNGATVDQPYIAAFDRATGVHLPAFAPDVDGEVRDIAISPDGTTVYLGGSFANVDGTLQRKLAAVRASNGSRIVSFDPKVLGGSVLAVEVAPDGDLFVGGRFESIDGADRIHVARLSPGGNLRSWSPDANGDPPSNAGAVRAFAIDAARNLVVVGGEFIDIDGAAQTAYMVAFRLDNGARLSNFPRAAYEVFGLDIAGGRLFVAMGGPGGRAGVYSLPERKLLRLYRTDGDVTSVSAGNGLAYFGGHWMNSFGGLPSSRLHAVRVVDGNLYTPFTPMISGSVSDVHHDGASLWVGGVFDVVEGSTHRGLVRFSQTGDPIDVDPPSRPTELRQTGATISSITMEWKRPGDDTGVVGYEVFRDGVKVGTPSVPRFVDKGLETDTAHVYRVRAFDASGNLSFRSDAVEGRTAMDVEAPSKPTNLRLVKRFERTMTLRWNRSTDNDGVGSYFVFRDGALVGITSSTSYVDTGLTSGTRYTYKVMAVDVNGNTSQKSSPVRGRTASTVIRQNFWWRYLDDGSDPGPDWAQRQFDVTSWPGAGAELGYGDGDERNVIDGGPTGDRHITTYFRRSFQVEHLDEVTLVGLRLLVDDGAAVYINGVEVARTNLPDGPLTPDVLAPEVVAGAAESEFQYFPLSKETLVAGWNVIAVEVHQAGPASSDVSFALAMTLRH